MSELRNISLTVEEPDPDHFHWVLLESTDLSNWSELLASEKSYPTWGHAFEDGCVALYRLVPDAKVGPRNPLRAGEKLAIRVEQQLRDMQKNRRLVRSFFQMPSVAYITDC